ncbi:MAG: general glycosylation pathway protein [Gammaproteobacteria bacterium]|nr:general glycosylation pathway protein [Gammaproteobacteria bacterium]
MSTMNYISVIERYHDYHAAIKELMASIVTGIADDNLMSDKEARCRAMNTLNEQYPFVDMLYILDPEGIQISDNTTCCDTPPHKLSGLGTDRSQRPYFLHARDSNSVIVTDPYFSSISGVITLTAALKWCDDHGNVMGYIALDIDLTKVIEFFMGDSARRRFQPLFKGTYSVIVIGLFAVVVALLFMAFSELWDLILAEAGSDEANYKPFSVVIYLTLSLAIFDLGKTTLEEEVLMHKDIFRHSSTRRTITRFIAAILIAVSIESLLLIFKSALGDGAMIIEAVWMMLSAVGLLVGLGIYVYLGAQAESLLRANSTKNPQE